jgi:hypothetical protein
MEMLTRGIFVSERVDEGVGKLRGRMQFPPLLEPRAIIDADCGQPGGLLTA